MAGVLDTLLKNESGGRNIANTTEGTDSGQAQGYFQITTGTWDEFGGKQFAPDPLHASYEQQAQIASKIPLNRWAPSTVALMKVAGDVDPNKTLGENLAANGESFAAGAKSQSPNAGATAPGAATPATGTGSAPAGTTLTDPTTGKVAPYTLGESPIIPVTPGPLIQPPVFKNDPDPYGNLGSMLASNTRQDRPRFLSEASDTGIPPLPDFASANPPPVQTDASLLDTGSALASMGGGGDASGLGGLFSAALDIGKAAIPKPLDQFGRRQPTPRQYG